METKRFSIIIPTYNTAGYIREAVESALAQRYDNKEVIVVDDGSTDNTRELLETYISRGEIGYIRQENAGPSTARNNGIRNATGHYVTLLDSDDLLCDGCIEALAGFLDGNPDVAFLFTNYDIFDETGVVNASGVDTWKVFRTIPCRVVGEGAWIFSEPLCRYIIKHGGFLHTSGTTIRRTTLDEVGYFKEGYFYGEDDELYARATYRSLSGYIDRVLSRKRNHSASLIHNKEKGLRNVRHYLDLTEHQLAYYQQDRELSALISRKLVGLVCDFCWGLQAAGRLEEAHALLLGYISRFRSAALLKLLLKNYLIRMGVLTSHA